RVGGAVVLFGASPAATPWGKDPPPAAPRAPGRRGPKTLPYLSERNACSIAAPFSSDLASSGREPPKSPPVPWNARRRGALFRRGTAEHEADREHAGRVSPQGPSVPRSSARNARSRHEGELARRCQFMAAPGGAGGGG